MADPIGARSQAHAWTYNEWCRNHQHDPESLDAILAFEELHDDPDSETWPTSQM